MRMFCHVLSAACLALAAPHLRAADLLPPDRPAEQVIDHYIDELIKRESVTPAAQADDATLVRRLTLDLVGRIPTAPEVRAYVESTDPQKRAKLVDRLMASPGFVRHQAAMFEATLNANLPNRGGSGALREYLNRALAENRPWSQIFKELLVPDEKDPKQKGAGDYLKDRVKDLDRLTADVSVAFFGVNVSCAQCHDHPLVKDWKQDHFYGMKSFFARTVDNGGFVAEREFGTLKFKPNKGAEKLARPIFLTGKAVELPNYREANGDEAKKEKERLDKAKAAKAPSPAAVSARAKLVEVALQGPEADFFARAIANRLWHRFLGYGLVNPLDQMHSENAPSHPELLAWLARDAATHGYDLRRLVRGIVMSHTYSRDSKYPSESQPQARFFAVANLKPLTPTQLATSLKVATSDPNGFATLNPEEFEKRIEGAGERGPRLRVELRPARRRLPGRRRRGAALHQRRPRDAGVPQRRRRHAPGTSERNEVARGRGRADREDGALPTADRRRVGGDRGLSPPPRRPAGGGA
jgi:hypothetical protein